MCAKTDILTTLAYFDIFKYPLTQTEIFFFLQRPCAQEDFVKALGQLQHQNLVFQLDDFFSLQDDYDLVRRRKSGNTAAKKLLQSADGVAKFLSSFPFVRGVGVSGSLSKNYADENSDIDFFIITKRNRLWLARTFMHCFKKFTYLYGKQHFFCMNYYVDEDGLEIKEKNIYTATELATLLPLRGIDAFQNLYKKNAWSREFLPNHSMRIAYTEEAKSTTVKKVIEWCFNHPLGTALDYALMKITASRWAKKTACRQLNANGNLMGMDAARHCAKPDPRTFQSRFMNVYEKAIGAALHKYNQRLKPVS